jgi:3-keto-5-aminohexanoate cleavage enzyme
LKPLIITAALTGAGPLDRSPHIPRSPRQIVQGALDAWRAGAAVVHIHGRLDDGSPTADPDVHERIAGDIRAAGCDVVLNFSAGDGGGRFDHAQRLGIIGTGSEIASFTPGSYNSGKRIYDNHPQFMRTALQRMREHGVRPEIEVIDVGFIGNIKRLIAEGEVAAPFNCLLVFGASGGMPPDAALLPLLCERLPDGAEWGVACFGHHEVHVALGTMALHGGGHVRTGLEDQTQLFGDRPATSNAELVEQWVATASIWGRPVASPAQARQMLGLAPLAVDAGVAATATVR